MKNLIAVITFCLLLFCGVYAQKAAPKFYSVYTNLEKNCKSIGGSNGTDPAFDCRGIGGYRIYNWSAAAAQFFAVTTQKSDETIQLATQNFDFNSSKIKAEWRMANGKPFAVIVRFNKYAEPINDGEYFGKKTGEELVIMGLKGFEHINFKVDCKTFNANAKARELADNSYLSK